MQRFIGLLALLVICSSCRSTQDYTYDRLPDTYLRFGSQGGFSGEVKSFTLLPNGQLFSTSSLTPGQVKELTPVKRAKASTFFDAARDSPCPDAQTPQNFNHFLVFKSATDSCRWIMAEGEAASRHPMRGMYDDLMETVAVSSPR